MCQRLKSRMQRNSVHSVDSIYDDDGGDVRWLVPAAASLFDRHSINLKQAVLFWISPQKRARQPPTVLAVISLSLRKHGAPKCATPQLSSSGWVLSIPFFPMSSTNPNGYALTPQEALRQYTNVPTACFTRTVALDNLCSMADRCSLLLFCDRHGPGWIPTRYGRETDGAIPLA